MNLIDFNHEFPDENSCRIHFKEVRDKAGVECKKCGGTHHWWLNSRQMYHCKNCGKRTSLKAGTVLENSKLSFRTWFIAFHLMSSTKKPISALEAQRQIGHKFYEPIWALMHKIRRGMGNQVESVMQFSECDQVFAKIQTFPKGLDPSEIAFEQKIGQPLVTVLVPKCSSNSTMGPQMGIALSSNHALKAKTHQKKERPAKKRNRKLIKILDVPQSIPRKSGPHLAKIYLTVQHLKAILQGVHCGVSRTYLQNYLNEFCFKHAGRNRLFDSILASSAIHWNS